MFFKIICVLVFVQVNIMMHIQASVMTYQELSKLEKTLINFAQLLESNQNESKTVMTNMIKLQLSQYLLSEIQKKLVNNVAPEYWLLRQG